MLDLSCGFPDLRNLIISFQIRIGENKRILALSA